MQLLSNSIPIDGVSIVNRIKEYITYQTIQLKQKTSGEILSSRSRLLRNRQRSSLSKNKIGVSPEPYLDLIDNPFNTVQWNQLTLGMISPLLYK